MEVSGAISAVPITRPGRAARARSMNSATAPNSSISSRVGWCQGQGNVSDGTRQITSPGTPRPSRLVARIHSWGQPHSNCIATAAASSKKLFTVVENQQSALGPEYSRKPLRRLGIHFFLDTDSSGHRCPQQRWVRYFAQINEIDSVGEP